MKISLTQYIQTSKQNVAHIKLLIMGESMSTVIPNDYEGINTVTAQVIKKYLAFVMHFKFISIIPDQNITYFCAR